MLYVKKQKNTKKQKHNKIHNQIISQRKKLLLGDKYNFHCNAPSYLLTYMHFYIFSSFHCHAQFLQWGSAGLITNARCHTIVTVP